MLLTRNSSCIDWDIVAFQVIARTNKRVIITATIKHKIVVQPAAAGNETLIAIVNCTIGQIRNIKNGPYFAVCANEVNAICGSSADNINLVWFAKTGDPYIKFSSATPSL